MYILQDGKYFCLSAPLIIREKKNLTHFDELNKSKSFNILTGREPGVIGKIDTLKFSGKKGFSSYLFLFYS